MLSGVTSVRLDEVTTATPAALVFVVTANGQARLSVSLSVDARGLISGLFLRPATATPSMPPAPASWSGVERAVRSVAPQVRFLTAAVSGGTCAPIQSIGAATPAPLGSAFKLYVLDALARAVAAGPGQLGPAAHHHQRRQEPAVGGAAERAGRHPAQRAAGGRRT